MPQGLRARFSCMRLLWYQREADEQALAHCQHLATN